jgi:hypothetical protein
MAPPIDSSREQNGHRLIARFADADARRMALHDRQVTPRWCGNNEGNAHSRRSGAHPDGASQGGLPALPRFTGMHARDCVPTAADGISPRPPFAWPSPKNVLFVTAANSNCCVRFVAGVTVGSRNTCYRAARYGLTRTGLAPVGLHQLLLAPSEIQVRYRIASMRWEVRGLWYSFCWRLRKSRLDAGSPACVGKFEGCGTIKSRLSSSMVIVRRHTKLLMSCFVPIRLG